MKKILAILLIIVLCLAPILACAEGPAEPAATIKYIYYDGWYLGGMVSTQGGEFWARCVLFLPDIYIVLCIPISRNGTFGVYISSEFAEYIAVSIKDTPGTYPTGTLYDTHCFAPSPLW